MSMVGLDRAPRNARMGKTRGRHRTETVSSIGEVSFLLLCRGEILDKLEASGGKHRFQLFRMNGSHEWLSLTCSESLELLDRQFVLRHVGLVNSSAKGS